MKTAAEIASEVAADWIEDGVTRNVDFRLARAAVELDRAQRTISFDALDHMLNAWETREVEDASAFIQAWVDHFNEGTEVPEWATA